jgi:hypothetical protein
VGHTINNVSLPSLLKNICAGFCFQQKKKREILEEKKINHPFDQANK